MTKLKKDVNSFHSLKTLQSMWVWMQVCMYSQVEKHLPEPPNSLGNNDVNTSPTI